MYMYKRSEMKFLSQVFHPFYTYPCKYLFLYLIILVLWVACSQLTECINERNHNNENLNASAFELFQGPQKHIRIMRIVEEYFRAKIGIKRFLDKSLQQSSQSSSEIFAICPSMGEQKLTEPKKFNYTKCNFHTFFHQLFIFEYYF